MAENMTYTGLISRLQNNLFNSSVAGRMTEELMDPALIWDREGFLTSFSPVSSRDIMGPMKRGTSGSESSSGLSAYKVKPPIHEPGTIYPSVDVEGYFVEHYTTKEYGYKLLFNEDLQDNSPGSAKRITDSYADMARWLAEFTNWEVLDGALNSFSYTSGSELAAYTDNSTTFGYDTTLGFLCGKLNEGAYWNGLDPDFVTDIENLKTAFRKQSGYNYRLDRMYMDITLLEDMKLWLYENGHSWEQDPTGGGLGRDTIRFDGVTIIGTTDIDGMSGNEDKVILQDSRYTPATTYYVNKTYPGFGRWGQNAKVAVKSYRENEETNDWAVLYRLEQATVLDYPKAVGIIEVY